MSTAAQVAAVVVTFNPDFTELEAMVESLQGQVGAVVLVDNSGNDAVSGWLARKKLSCRSIGLTYTHNVGLAAAQNRGIDWALSNGFSYVLLLDQDSVPAPDMVNRLWRAFSALSIRAKVAAVGPCYRELSGRTFFFVQLGRFALKHVRCATGQESVPVDFLISSGSLVSSAALRDIGFMDDGLFIDHIDTDWFLRAAAKGYKAFGICQALMTHRLGSGTVGAGSWLSRVPLYGAHRHYYLFRNSILLYRRRYAPARWIFADMQRLLVMALVYCVFVKPRFAHLNMISKGLWDGFRRRDGALQLDKT